MVGRATAPAVGRRRVVVLGDGVIGTTYGMLLAEAGHEVRHLIRPQRLDQYPMTRRVTLLDGRTKPAREYVRDYTVTPCRPGSDVDLVLVSVPDAKLAGALESIGRLEVTGPLLIMTAVWESRRWLVEQLGGRPYLLGYPVAGGGMVDGAMHCVVFGHVMLEARGPGRDTVAAMFAHAGIATEAPPDMLEWIWLHVAINAGVIAVAAAEGDPRDPTRAARQLMDSVELLGEAVLTVRECLAVAQARGVPLNRYRKDVLPFRLPARVAATAMRRLFRKDLTARRIMELHNNPADLRALLLDVEHTRAVLAVPAPRFERYVERAVANLDRMLASG